MTELCKCTNCETILIDENPQIGAKKHDLKGISYSNMIQIEDDGEYFWGCPNCKVDDYLIDV